jgi:hypothetical protein
MTPQEQELVGELFDRLAKLENAPRDPAAERLIAEGLQQAPHAVYALVQTALIQDEALRRANDRIQELQALPTGPGDEEPHQGSFLDTMRDAVLGRRDARSSVPNIPPQAGSSPPTSSPAAPTNQVPPDYPPPMQPYSSGPGLGGGGSFLGSAASTAAGVIGGALLLDGIRSMFGHRAGVVAPDRTVFRSIDDKPPMGSASAADSDLAREAGTDHIGRQNVAGAAGDSELVDDTDDWNNGDDLADDGDFSDGDDDFA